LDDSELIYFFLKTEMFQEIWDSVLSHEAILYRSPLFFLLIAQATQFGGCLIFSFIDLQRHRVPFNLMIGPACVAVFGFLPFFLMWYTEILILEKDLPKKAPNAIQFTIEFVVCGVVGDFFHYWTHIWLHSNKTLKHHVHRIHHEYKGSLYSWVGMQVHPLEVVMITIAIYSPFILFAHPMVLWVFAFLATMNATFAHSGYNGGFSSMYLPFALTSSDHQLHHELNSTKNYGNILQVWDKLFETYGENKKFPTQSLWN